MKPGRPPKTDGETRSRIRAALRMGFGQSEVARKFGVSRDIVRYQARAVGILKTPSTAHVCSCGRKVRGHYGEEG